MLNENFIINQKQLLGNIDRILIKKSIAFRVSDIQALSGPVGVISGASWKNGKLSVKTTDIIAETRKIETQFSHESLQDLFGIYGEDIYNLIGHYVIDELMYRIDKDFIDFIKSKASNKGSFQFPGATYNARLEEVAMSIVIKVNKGLNDLAISDNRSPNAWAIVSSNVASLLSSAIGTFLPEDSSNTDDSPSFIGKIAGVDYYTDYTHINNNTDNIIFGIKGNGYSKGSTIISPYTRTWIDTMTNENGENVFFLVDRLGIGINPLDDGVISEFLGKFSIDLSDLNIMK